MHAATLQLMQGNIDCLYCTLRGSFASLPDRLSILFCVRDSRETSSPSLNFAPRVLRLTVMYLGTPALMPAYIPGCLMDSPQYYLKQAVSGSVCAATDDI